METAVVVVVPVLGAVDVAGVAGDGGRAEAVAFGEVVVAPGPAGTVAQSAQVAHLDDVADLVVAQLFAVALEGLEVVAVGDGPAGWLGVGAAVRLGSGVLPTGGTQETVEGVVAVLAAAGDAARRQRVEDTVPVGEVLDVGDVADGVVRVEEVLELGAAAEREDLGEAEGFWVVLVRGDSAVLILASRSLATGVVVEVGDDRGFGGATDGDVNRLLSLTLFRRVGFALVRDVIGSVSHVAWQRVGRFNAGVV